METRAHYVAVGSFVIVIVLCAFVAVLWLGRAELATQYSRYDIYFTGVVTGLSRGAAVQYNGVRIGRVLDVEIDPTNVEQIRVAAEIENRTVIKADAVATVETNLLSGVSTVQITGGTKDAPILVAEKDQPYPVIPSVRSRLERVYSRAPRLLERLIDLTESLNAVVDDRNRKNIAETLENLNSAAGTLADGTKQLHEITGGVNSALGGLDKLIRNVDQSDSGNGGLKDQLGTAISEFGRLAKNLNETNTRLQQTVQDARPGVREFSQRTLSQLSNLVSETRQLVSGLSRLASEIERDPTRFLFGDRREGYRPR